MCEAVIVDNVRVNAKGMPSPVKRQHLACYLNLQSFVMMCRCLVAVCAILHSIETGSHTISVIVRLELP